MTLYFWDDGELGENVERRRNKKFIDLHGVLCIDWRIILNCVLET